jgi:hypothetical protein
MEPMQTDIEKNVMRRVHLMRLLGLVISTAVLAFLTFVLALWGIGREVWVARVFENMPESGDFREISRFYFNAFGHTRLIVQALTIVSLAALIYLIRETYRTLVGFFTTPYS